MVGFHNQSPYVVCYKVVEILPAGEFDLAQDGGFVVN